MRGPVLLVVDAIQRVYVKVVEDIFNLIPQPEQLELCTSQFKLLPG